LGLDRGAEGEPPRPTAAIACGDPAEPRAVAKHVTHLQIQPTPPDLVDERLERREIVAGWLVVPQVLARRDHLRGHRQTLVVARFDRHRPNARVVEHPGSLGWLDQRHRLHVGVVLERLPLAHRVAVIGANLRDAYSGHQSDSFTGRPVRPDSYTPWMIATTRRPSNPVTAGGRLSRIAPTKSVYIAL